MIITCVILCSGLTQLKAFLREDSGKKISKTIRKVEFVCLCNAVSFHFWHSPYNANIPLDVSSLQGGRVPGVVFSLPQEQELLVSFAAKDIETQVLLIGSESLAMINSGC